MTVVPATPILKKSWGAFVDWLATDAQALSNGNGIPAGDVLARNAIAHAFTSAVSASRWGSWIAEGLGDLKELVSTTNNPLDEWKDQFNNEVGRRIAEYVENNNLPTSAIDDLVIDALNNMSLLLTQRLTLVPSTRFRPPGAGPV